MQVARSWEDRTSKALWQPIRAVATNARRFGARISLRVGATIVLLAGRSRAVNPAVPAVTSRTEMIDMLRRVYFVCCFTLSGLAMSSRSAAESSVAEVEGVEHALVCYAEHETWC